MENKKLIIIIKDFVNKANEDAKKYLEAINKIRDKDNTDKDYITLIKKSNSYWGRYRALNYVISTLLCEYKINLSFAELGLIIL